MHLRHSDETRKKISDALKKRWQDPIYRTQVRCSVCGDVKATTFFSSSFEDIHVIHFTATLPVHLPPNSIQRAQVLQASNRTRTGGVSHHTDETRRIISEKIKKRWRDPEYRTRVLNASNGTLSRETRDKIAATLKKRWQDPEFRTNMTKRISGARSEQHKQRIAAAIRSKWNQSDYRERTLAGISLRSQEVRDVYSGPCLSFVCNTSLLPFLRMARLGRRDLHRVFPLPRRDVQNRDRPVESRSRFGKHLSLRNGSLRDGKHPRNRRLGMWTTTTKHRRKRPSGETGSVTPHQISGLPSTMMKMRLLSDFGSTYGEFRSSECAALESRSQAACAV